MTKKLIYIICFIFLSFSTRGQSKEDSIKQLIGISKKYLNNLFNSRNVSAVVDSWSQNIYSSLKVGYNNGGIKYSSNWDLQKLFWEDFNFVFDEVNSQFEFIQDSIILFGYYSSNTSEPVKDFLISFKMSDKVKIDSMLNWVALDFYSEDNGKTWKLGSDHWIQRFMYYLYREGNSKRPYSRKMNYR